MREPVALVRELDPGARFTDLPPSTKLYALPPDAAGEIERLRTDLETAERALDAQTDFRKEIARLRTALFSVRGYSGEWHPDDQKRVSAALAKEMPHVD